MPRPEQQLNGLSIACPSVLVYRQPRDKQPTVTIEILEGDSGGTFRSKSVVEFSRPLLPFQVATRSHNRRSE